MTLIRSFLDLIINFFLHIQINTLNRSFSKKLPDPYGSNRVSFLLANIMEKNWIRRVFGFNLAAAMVAIPLVIGNQPQLDYEPPLNLERSDLISIESTTHLTTETRQFVLPVERLRYVGQYFSGGHPGYDLNSYIGDAVYAFSGGRVFQTENGVFGLGRFVVLDHGQNLFSVYGHLKEIQVQVGQTVEAGQQIGTVGMTGYTTGPHLHFEVHDNGRAVNPGKYLKLQSL